MRTRFQLALLGTAMLGAVISGSVLGKNLWDEWDKPCCQLSDTFQDVSNPDSSITSAKSALLFFGLSLTAISALGLLTGTGREVRNDQNTPKPGL